MKWPDRVTPQTAWHIGKTYVQWPYLPHAAKSRIEDREKLQCLNR